MARYFDESRYDEGGDFRGTGLTPEEITIVQEQISSNLVGEVTIPQLTATANNLGLPEGISFRLSTNGAAQVITGFANVTGGRFVHLHNVAGGANITLNEQDLGSTVENRIITGLGNVIIQPNRSAILMYDSITARWRLQAFT